MKMYDIGIYEYEKVGNLIRTWKCETMKLLEIIRFMNCSLNFMIRKATIHII